MLLGMGRMIALLVRFRDPIIKGLRWVLVKLGAKLKEPETRAAIKGRILSLAEARRLALKASERDQPGHVTDSETLAAGLIKDMLAQGTARTAEAVRLVESIGYSGLKFESITDHPPLSKPVPPAPKAPHQRSMTAGGKMEAPTDGLSKAYMFPLFQTREAYRTVTGQEAPPYDPSLPLKGWFDPDAATRTSLFDAGEDIVVYPRVIALGPDKRTPSVNTGGRPFTRPLMIDRATAGRVNIPVKSFDTATAIPDVPAPLGETPVPLRELTADEEYVFGFGNTVQIKNKQAWAAQVGTAAGLPAAMTLSAADRKLLADIWEGVNAIRAKLEA